MTAVGFTIAALVDVLIVKTTVLKGSANAVLPQPPAAIVVGFTTAVLVGALIVKTTDPKGTSNAAALDPPPQALVVLLRQQGIGIAAVVVAEKE